MHIHKYISIDLSYRWGFKANTIKMLYVVFSVHLMRRRTEERVKVGSVTALSKVLEPTCSISAKLQTCVCSPAVGIHPAFCETHPVMQRQV